MTGAEAIALVRAHTLMDLIKLVTIKIANVPDDGMTVTSETPTHRIVVRVTKTKLRAKKPTTPATAGSPPRE